MNTLRRTAVVAIALGVLLRTPLPVAQTMRYEHRVVVSTSASDRDSEISASLERHVNALAARGFEVAAFTGGNAALLDQWLDRRVYSPAGADDAGLTLVVMARPVAMPVVARTYRLLHVREQETLATVVGPLGAQGYHLTVAEFDGGVTHLAFERRDDVPPVEYREFRNRFRNSWMDQLLADGDVRARMRRVLPVALGAGIVELGPPQATPGDVSWLSRQAHQFEAMEDRIREMAATGYRVELVRRRGVSDLDVLMLKPAGAAASQATWDLDDGPWGGPCSRGVIAGAAVGPDGDVYCAANRAGTPPSNRGLDLTLLPQSTAGGAVLFRGPTCDIRARLTSNRPASARLALALQFEREIAAAIQPGFRVTRALATDDTQHQGRIAVFTTDAPAATLPAGTPADRSPAPQLTTEVDSVGNDFVRQRELVINETLAARGLDGTLWVELDTLGRSRSASLLGCVPSRLTREAAESAARTALINHGFSDYRLNNKVLVER